MSKFYRGILHDTSIILPYRIVHNELYYTIHINDTAPATAYRQSIDRL